MIYISKKKVYSKHLEKGRFYRHYDSNGGHPALIYYKNDKKNVYKSIKFTSETGSSRTKLKNNIDMNSLDDCYVHNNPVLGTRHDYSRKKWNKEFKIRKKDKILINKIKRKK